jgi:hypothetical protein
MAFKWANSKSLGSILPRPFTNSTTCNNKQQELQLGKQQQEIKLGHHQKKLQLG